MLYLIPLVAALALAVPLDQPGAAVQGQVGGARVAAAWDPTLGLDKVAAAAGHVAGEFAPSFGFDKTQQAPRNLDALAQLAAEAGDKFWGSIPAVVQGIEDKIKEIKEAFKAKADALDSAVGKLFADKIKAIEDKIAALKDAKTKVDAAAVEAIQAEVKAFEALVEAKKDFFDATIGEAIKAKAHAIEDKIGALAGIFHFPLHRRGLDEDLATSAPQLGAILQKIEAAWEKNDPNAAKAVQAFQELFKNPAEIAPKFAQVVDSFGKQVEHALQGRPIYVPANWEKNGEVTKRGEDEGDEAEEDNSEETGETEDTEESEDSEDADADGDEDEGDDEGDEGEDDGDDE